MRHWTVSAALIMLLLVEVPALRADPYELLREGAAKADLVLFGSLANPRLGHDANGNPTASSGTTDFQIAKTLKLHPALGDRRRLEVQRHLTIDPKANQHLVFCKVVEGKIDPYWGTQATPAIVDYLRGMLELEPASPRKVLAHAFRHLEHPDPLIADDALLEFVRADYEDLRGLGPTLRPDMLARWLQEEKKPQFHRVGGIYGLLFGRWLQDNHRPVRYHILHARGMYALLLGHCGGEADARLLRRIIETTRKGSHQHENLLIGYALLDPRKGLQVIRTLLQSADLSFWERKHGFHSFWERDSALRAVCFFWDTRPGHLPRKDLYDAICLLLDQADMAGFAVQELHRRELWDATDRVLALENDKYAWNSRSLRGAVVKYALECPRPEAAALIRRMRERDAKLVERLEADLGRERKR